MSMQHTHQAPPVIRVFLSSTFADMEQERSYFNEVLVPRISRICAERGVSFFSVDLRWGITQEEQVNGQVLPICLGEIDKCRPYFIGIVGNRYGSVLEEVPPPIVQSIPWLAGKEGHSITELEMLYAVLDTDQDNGCTDSAFYFRTDRLSQELYGRHRREDDTALGRLDELKHRIAESGVAPYAHYDSMEEFGELVMRDLLRWLDTHFPPSTDVAGMRRAWYDGELLRDYIPVDAMNTFLDAYVAESKKPLLVYGDGARGKTACLAAWQPKEGRKITVNIAADDGFSYWPSVARYLVQCVNDMEPQCGAPEGIGDLSADGSHFFFTTDAALERFRLAFLRWFGSLQVSQPLTVVINDLNRLDDEQGRLLAWLPAVMPQGVRLLGSTNDDEMVKNASLMGWNSKEMTLLERESAATLVADYLHAFGKKISPDQMARLTGSVCARYPGQLRFVAAFLVNFGRFNNLDELLRNLCACRGIADLYGYVYRYLMQNYSRREMTVVRLVLALVRCASFSLNEGVCYAICRRIHDVTPIEWARCCRIFEQFDIIHGDYWNLRDRELEKFAEQLLDGASLKEAHGILGDLFLQRLGEESDDDGIRSIRQHTAYAEAVLRHYRCAESWEKLTAALKNPLVLCRLYNLGWQHVRVAWMALFLHTQCAIPEHLIALARQYMEQGNKESRAIALRLAGVFVDFGYETDFDEMCRVVGTTHIPSGLNAGLERTFSDAFAPRYQQMYTLKAEGRYRDQLAFTEHLLETASALPAADLCQVLFFRAEAESRLHLYDVALQTVNEYYATSLKAGLVNEMVRSLTMRGEILFRQGRDREAASIQERLAQMALNNGDLRSYLATRNVLGMCYYHMERYTESMGMFDTLMEQWVKLGNVAEIGTTYLNKCNALHLSGRAQDAMQLAKSYYDLTCTIPSLRGICVQLLGNMGRYATSLEEYDTAEQYLTDAIAQAKEIGHESALLSAYNALVELYVARGRTLMAADVCEEQLEFLWTRQEYESLLSTMDKTIEWLLHYGYAKRARVLEANWRERFATLAGGAQLFEQRTYGGAVDSVQVDDLQEQLIMAKGQNNVALQATLRERMADVVAKSSPQEAAEHLLEAIALYRAEGQWTSFYVCVQKAVGLLIKKGRPLDTALCERLVTAADKDALGEIIDLWTSLAGKTEEDDTVAPRLLGVLRSVSPNESLRYRSFVEMLVVACCVDMAEVLIYVCPQQDLIDLVEGFTGRARQLVYDTLDAEMFEAERKMHNDLKADFFSSSAVQKLRFCEKAIAFLCHFDSMNGAALAGNIALIFRRRKDKEKTLYYHNLSVERFRKVENHHDALIEMLNMATAYLEFGDEEGSVRLLREAAQYAREVHDAELEASICGNLASDLMRRGNPDDGEEILRCFAVEEQYFRSVGNARDLVISLVNQMAYLHDKTDPSVWRDKLEEAGRLVRKNHLDEFRTAVGRLEWFAAQHGSASRDIGDDGFRQRIEALLAAVGGYRLAELDRSNGAYRAACDLAESKIPGGGRLFLFYHPDEPGVLTVTNVYQPSLRIKSSASLQAYLDWWNGFNEYQLNLDLEQNWIRADGRLLAADWDKLTPLLRRFLTLWEMDVLNVMGLLVGIADLDAARGAKLQCFNGDQEDT